MLHSRNARPLPPRVQPLFAFPSRRERVQAHACECTAREQKPVTDAASSEFIARVQCDCISGLKFVLGVEPRGATPRA